nr:LINE-type retrotransposon LIb DNA [Ipomoea batatas]
MNSVQMVEYEGLHVVCFNCGVVGHREQSCPSLKPVEIDHANMDLNESPTPKTENNQPVDTAMPTSATMMVTRKEKPTPQVKNHRQNKKPSNSVPSCGNQFNALVDNHDLDEPHMTQKSANKNKAKVSPLPPTSPPLITPCLLRQLPTRLAPTSRIPPTPMLGVVVGGMVLRGPPQPLQTYPLLAEKRTEMAGAGGRERQPSAAVELLAKAADEGRRTRNEAASFTATHSHWLPCRWSALPSPPLCFIVDSTTSCRLVRTREMGMKIGLDFWK